MIEDFELTMMYLIFIVSSVIIGGSLYLASLSAENESAWAAKCEQAGGIASKYSTMVGKTTHSERLCIKKENVVEVGK
jgi:hypothetical protein